jgi:hypothetical protein
MENVQNSEGNGRKLADIGGRGTSDKKKAGPVGGVGGYMSPDSLQEK